MRSLVVLWLRGLAMMLVTSRVRRSAAGRVVVDSTDLACDATRAHALPAARRITPRLHCGRARFNHQQRGLSVTKIPLHSHHAAGRRRARAECRGGIPWNGNPAFPGTCSFAFSNHAMRRRKPHEPTHPPFFAPVPASYCVVLLLGCLSSAGGGRRGGRVRRHPASACDGGTRSLDSPRAQLR